MQETAYAAMFLERTGIEVKKIVTLIATEEGSIQVFEKYNLDDYLQLLKSYIEEFVKDMPKEQTEDKFLHQQNSLWRLNAWLRRAMV